MGCEKYESGIIMKVEVKVTKRDMQRFPESLGNKDIDLDIDMEFTEQILITSSPTEEKQKSWCHSQVILPGGGESEEGWLNQEEEGPTGLISK